MKWKVKQPQKEGVVKYATIFPLIPRLIKDTWYWLERVDVKYEYKWESYYGYDDFMGYCETRSLKWILVGLDDRPEIECKYIKK